MFITGPSSLKDLENANFVSSRLYGNVQIVKSVEVVKIVKKYRNGTLMNAD
jgi:hypothetical protein